MLANVPGPNCISEFAVTNCHTYEEFMAVNQDSCKGMLAMVRDTYQQALTAAVMLQDKIEQMRHSDSHHHSGGHCCSSSH